MIERFDRNIRFFGATGQELLTKSRVAVAGVGGLGTHVIQQLSYLGVGSIVLIDEEQLDNTNLNRYVLSRHSDLGNFPLKVDVAEREILAINPDINVVKVPKNVVSSESHTELKKSDYIFGCFDCDGPRLRLNELCSAYEIPYIDLASDIDPVQPMAYGGRVFIAWDGTACMVCMGILDVSDIQMDQGGEAFRAQHKAIYGVDQELLGETGPSVVSVNGVVASYAVTEFIVGVTGIRKPVLYSEYRGQDGKILVSSDEPIPDCYYCKGIRGTREDAGMGIMNTE